MSSAITKFSERIRHKLYDVEQRLEALKSVTETQVSHAEKAVRAHVDTLEAGARTTKQRLDQARIEVAAWVDDTREVVAEWKTKLDSTMLRARADRSERFAEAALVIALAGVDQAERAMLSAGLARGDAEAASKS